jgi:hypothetical protein
MVFCCRQEKTTYYHLDTGTSDGVKALSDCLIIAKTGILDAPEVLSRERDSDFEIAVGGAIRRANYEVDKIHSLIESHGVRFILSGSSARKLRRSRTNLLAGRASIRHLFPLTFREQSSRFLTWTARCPSAVCRPLLPAHPSLLILAQPAS